MAPLFSSQPIPNTDVGTLNKIQKLAALLIILGPESTSKIFRELDELEVAAISAEMTRLPVIETKLRDEILEEFIELATPDAALLSSLRTRDQNETTQKDQNEA